MSEQGYDFQAELKKANDELLKYKNSNTPPSSNKHLKPETSGKQAKTNSKRGAPMGHIGTTKILEPDVYEEVDEPECPNCHGKDKTDI